jgi:hypothetical protein
MIAISHFFTFSLRVFLSSSVSTPALAPSGSPPPQGPRRRSPRAAIAHQFLSRVDPPRGSRWLIFLQIRKMSSSTPHKMRILRGGSSVTSVTVFLGRLTMPRSSSSVTLMKKRRRVRRMPPMPILCHLLL